jgi:hypothetical protein
MTQIDKTRDKLKVEELENSDRKALFDKFVKAGGKVVKEKKKPVKIDRAKQKEFARKLEEHRKKVLSAYPSETVTSKDTKNILSSTNRQASGLDTFWARIRLFFMGVTNLGGDYFKKSFLEQFRSEFNPAIMELQLIYLDLFKQNPAYGYKIIEQLDMIRPLYYELIEMSGDIWEQTISASLVDRYTILPDEKYRVFDQRDTILKYFRKLYILQRYVDTINFAFDKAIDLQAISERGKASIYAAKRKKIRNCLYVVFFKMYPRLYWLFCMMRGEIIPQDNEARFDSLFDIKPFMKPGSRTANQPPSDKFGTMAADSANKKKESVPDAEPSSEKEKVSEDIRRGLELMKEIDQEKLLSDLGRNELVKVMDSSDRIRQIFISFLEFDREYSSVLTTFKIKFYSLHDSRGQGNFRSKLSDIYNRMKPAYDSMRDYFTALLQYEETRKDRPTSNDQYYKYTKRLTEIENDKNERAKAARAMIQSFMSAVAAEMLALIQDMNVRHEIVQNPQDILEFDNTVEENRKQNGKRVFNAIVDTYSYAAAFLYRLSPMGDLCGNSEETDKGPSTFLSTQSQPTYVKTVPSPGQKTGTPKPNNYIENETQKNTGGSILGELDDIEKIDDIS